MISKKNPLSRGHIVRLHVFRSKKHLQMMRKFQTYLPRNGWSTFMVAWWFCNFRISGFPILLKGILPRIANHRAPNHQALTSQGKKEKNHPPKVPPIHQSWRNKNPNNKHFFQPLAVFTEFVFHPTVSLQKMLETHRIHVWNVYLHLP